MDKFYYCFFFFLAGANLAEHFGEYFEWFGNRLEPHFSHGAAVLMWVTLAILLRRIVVLEKNLASVIAHSPAR